MTKQAPKSDDYDDNILVRRRKGGADFFMIRLQEPTGHSPHTSMLNRYTVPGRTDVYTFGWWPGDGSHVGFYTDLHLTLPEALVLLRRDLDKPQVVKLLVEMIDKVPLCMSRDLVTNLLWSVGAGTKALRACKKALERKRIKAHAEWEVHEAQRGRR